MAKERYGRRAEHDTRGLSHGVCPPVTERNVGVGDDPNLDTYYVYNNRNQLSYVLSPEYQNSGYKDQYAYEYRYDEHGRLHKKLLPGCDFTQYWYDKKGRVISEQNPTLRENGKYRFTLYDNLGRVAIQGVCTNVNYHRKFDVTMSTSPGFLDTRYNYPYASAITHPDLEVVNYYDNYDFLFCPLFSPHLSQMMHATTNSHGLLTGQVRRVKANSYILTAFYYDEKGQMIEKMEILQDGSSRTTATAYSFTGKPISETTTLTRNNTTYTEQKDLEYYDENDKLKKLTIGYNGTDSLLIGQYVYDDLGRVSTLQRGGNAGDVSYNYNLRGWTTHIDGKGFKEWLHYTDGIGIDYFTGNISSMLWQTDNQNFKRGYCFYYDEFGRMTQAFYGEGEDMSEHTNRYTEWVKEYTRSGGIRKIERYGLKDDGKYGKIDNLRMYYNGMKIRTVKEDALPVTRSGAFDFVSKTVNVVGAEYDYYDDGALRWDANKGISLIQYDDRGYPSRVQFSNGNVTEYIYASDGEKLRTVYQTAVPNISVALGSTLTLNTSNTLSTDTIEYVGNFIFRNGVLEKALFTGGYATFANNQATYHYFTQDHLGNNRAVVNQDGTVEQRVHYYPFGAVYAHVSTDALQRYKYNGKELDRMYGLNQYDYGARNYDPLLCRFTTVDPLAEKYYGVSPYTYCLNNPVNAIDNNGKYTIFVNGFHSGWEGASSKYWNGFDRQILRHFGEIKHKYYDGSIGGLWGLAGTMSKFGIKIRYSNMSASTRYTFGYHAGVRDVESIINSLNRDKEGNISEILRIVSHSMGSAYAKGLVQAIMNYVTDHPDETKGIRIVEYDFAPYQPSSQEAVNGVDTYQYSHKNDVVAGSNRIPGANYVNTTEKGNAMSSHSISSFLDYINQLPEGNYKIENGQIIKK